MTSIAVSTGEMVFGPQSAGLRLTPRAFDRAAFQEGWRYELIEAVLVVTPSPKRHERDPNDELGYLLRDYQRNHPQGHCVDVTVAEETIDCGGNRRRADRAIWVGLGRLPRPKEPPTIVVEFVSAGRRNQVRDYLEKRDEYLAAGVVEYWVFDRFARTMTVYRKVGGRARTTRYRERSVVTTPLLPGFELRLEALLALADRWPEEDDAGSR